MGPSVDVSGVSKTFLNTENLAPGSGTRGEDVALLKFDFPAHAAPAALPQAEPGVGHVVRTVGWGDHDLPENPEDP